MSLECQSIHKYQLIKMAIYYIWRNGLQEGPFEAQAIISMNLSSDTLVWCEGMSGWTPISQVHELWPYHVVPPPFTHQVPPQFPNQGPPLYGQEYQQQNVYQQQNDYQQQYSQYEEDKKGLFKDFFKGIPFLIIVGLVFLYKCSGDSDTADDADVQITEQTQESEAGSQKSTYEQGKEADHQASEQAEKENEKEKMLEFAQKAGYEAGFNVGPSSYITDDPKRKAKLTYTSRYGAPTSSEEKEAFEKFVSKYVEAYEEGHKAQQ